MDGAMEGKIRGLTIGRARAAVTVLVCGLLFAGAGAAQDSAIRLEIDALVQEGGLVRDELERLSAPGKALTQEDAQLTAEEKSLRAASRALNQDIQAFNAALKDLEQEARAHQARCPRESEDATLVETCNARAAEIRAQAEQRDAQRPALDKRQLDLNAGIERHNAARQDWAQRKAKHDQLAQLNRRDLVVWLERAERFFAGDGFRAAYQTAAGPAACSAAGLRDLAAAPSAETAERALACLHALVRR
jgi:hypothetical protein